jgi:hypothetical protein
MSESFTEAAERAVTFAASVAMLVGLAIGAAMFVAQSL